MKPANYRTILFCLLTLGMLRSVAQPELEPWGNMTGIRVDGQLMEFGSSLRVIGPDGTVQFTAKERQNPHFSRVGKEQLVTTHLDSLYFVESISEGGRGEALVRVRCSAHADIRMKGAYFSLDIPADWVEGGKVERVDSSGVRISAPHRWLEIRLNRPAPIRLDAMKKIDIPLHQGPLQNGQSVDVSFLITVGGEIDRAPIHLSLDTAATGRPFDGLGGNFRIQNTRLDPQVINYCLDHLRLAWGRVELPWRFWQPVKESNPMDSARAGRLHPGVQRAMDMAKTLNDKKIPIILSAWFPPDWAIVGPIRFRPGPDHVWGNPLDKTNTEAIYKSITDYILFLKQQYKVEISYFSFNESDLGINVRQTAEEHRDLIKGLGAYFASSGLATKVLLGDNSDATTWSFIDAAVEDPSARPFMGAVSFHSWRGWDTATLEKWSDAATKLHLPLLVGEGSIDAAAWNYPAIFLEPTYALKEIDLYTRLLAICQPLSILQWQLTADYSPLTGGGIFGDTGTLRPTQRFWNLKQLSLSPKGLFAMPLHCDRQNITVAALGNTKQNKYALHLVNNGATREVRLKGLPGNVKTLRIYTTNQTLSVKEGKPVRVSRGQARFLLEARSYVTLLADAGIEE